MCLITHRAFTKTHDARWFKYKFNTITLVVISIMDTEELVTIPISRFRRLEELEALEAEMPARIQAAIKEDGKQRLAVLNAKKKADPVKNAKGVLKKYHQNKEEINARRREAYRSKKLNADGTVAPVMPCTAAPN